MSVDNISDLGRHGLDELVPSRYAVEVGEIDVLVISDGVLPITSRTMATNADAGEYGQWLDDRFLPRDVLDWPLNVVVVRSGGRTILVDAGLGVEFPDFPRAGQTIHRLEAAGIDPQEGVFAKSAFAVMAVARQSRQVRHQRIARTREPVE